MKKSTFFKKNLKNIKNSKNFKKIDKNGKKWQKLEKPKIAHEIYRKPKKEGHASRVCFFYGMQLSTKKNSTFFPIGGYFFIENSSKF
jgi:hypothetical protein